MKFDPTKPFGECSGAGTASYFQEGRYFNYHHEEVDEEGFCARCADGKCRGCSDACKGCDDEECATCDNGCEGCDNEECNFCDNGEDSGLSSVDYASLSWDDLRAASRAAGGPATNKRACLEFLGSL